MAMTKQFAGELAFLSNMYPDHPVRWQGRWWPTSEHAYVGMKFVDPELQSQVQALATPWDAKQFGRRHAATRTDWDRVRLPLMHAIVTDKFTRHADLRAQLLATDPTLLVERNTWGDTFWGVCDGMGQNWLGRVLAEVQQQLRRVVHCKRSPHDVYVGRPGPWGNPVPLPSEAHRDAYVDQYRDWLLAQPHLRARIPELTDKTLGCWCAPRRCHADVLAWLASVPKFINP
jgi:ribA/ribD-fused uncharacterized protein